VPHRSNSVPGTLPNTDIRSAPVVSH